MKLFSEVNILLCLALAALVTAKETAAEQYLRRNQDATETDVKWFETELDERYNYIVPSQGIVAGTEAAAGEFPFIVSLEYQGKIYCGGSLIAPNRVLSAAHCFFTSTGAVFLPTQIRVGHTNTTNGETVGVSCVSIHPNYGMDYVGLYSDFAVITLATSIKTNITPVVLNNNTGYPATSGQPLTPIGFGRTVNGGPTSTTLQKTTENFVTETDCKADWPCASTSFHVCAKGATSNGVCQGDSGGPLLDANKVQVGITSFGSGRGCATGVPNVFANVAPFYSWIQGELTSGKCTTSHTYNEDTPCADYGSICGLARIFREARDFVVNYFK